MSGIDTRESDNAFLQSIGTLDIFTDKNHFVYMNDALAAAEDRILEEALGDSRYDDQLSFQEIDIITGFSEQESQTLMPYFEQKE